MPTKILEASGVETLPKNARYFIYGQKEPEIARNLAKIDFDTFEIGNFKFFFTFLD